MGLKLLDLNGELFNVNAIQRISKEEGHYAKIFFSDGKKMSVSETELKKILDFAEAEAIEIVETKIPQTPES